ncbi:EsaB/YukD family protein [Niallia taxi]|uniref:EsaB/YukD family protein n=1 Tax=Niallia taxi TaxID=2499688 RepID=UPI003D28773F
MYIEVTVDLHKYDKETIDLRLSDFYTIKKMIDISWQVSHIDSVPRSGYWVRVKNKQKVFPGNRRLADAGITSGDIIEIL